jgi:hypothetical protein
LNPFFLAMNHSFKAAASRGGFRPDFGRRPQSLGNSAGHWGRRRPKVQRCQYFQRIFAVKVICIKTDPEVPAGWLSQKFL